MGRIDDAAVVWSDGRVSWVGPTDEGPDADRHVDGSGCIGMPGLVDMHTHAVWAGSRSVEFGERLAGADYAAILEAGGGILSTVRAVRETGVDALVDLAAGRLSRLASRGVTLVEIKSGYGLTPTDEHKLLIAAGLAAERVGLDVRRTFLGAHTVPAEFRGDRGAYVDQVVEQQLPLVSADADFCDVYVDRGAFTVDEGERILRAGQQHGLRSRIHAEQVVHTGAAAMAAGLGALSADHLERLDEAGIRAMADAGTIAGLLPGAMLYLRDPAPPIDAMREAGIRFAVGSDLNPGTSPVDDLWTAATLAALTMRVRIDEALLGITAVAADALGATDHGRIRPGARGGLLLIEPPPGEPTEPAVLVQHLGARRMRVIRG